MKNNTFNQVINANLASIDPGRLHLLSSEIAGGGAFAWAARHVEADRHDDEHHRAADPQHTAAERVENPASDQRRERVRQRPHQVV